MHKLNRFFSVYSYPFKEVKYEYVTQRTTPFRIILTFIYLPFQRPLNANTNISREIFRCKLNLEDIFVLNYLLLSAKYFLFEVVVLTYESMTATMRAFFH